MSSIDTRGGETTGARIAQKLGEIVPEGCAVGWTRIGQWYPLFSAEALPSAAIGRQQEFSAGRTAARMAMERLGFPPSAVVRETTGAPLWPHGLIGAITHSGGIALAVLGQRARIRLLGVDLVAPADHPNHELLPYFLSEDELANISPNQPLVHTALLAAKEAGAKALGPLLNRVPSFLDLRVDLAADRSTFTIRLADCQGVAAPDSAIVGRLFREGGFQIAFCYLSPEPTAARATAITF